MPSGKITFQGYIGGLAINGAVERAEASQAAIDDSLPPGNAGTLSTRNSDTAGTITLTTGHGINDGDQFMLFWADGLAYNCTAGEVAEAPGDTAVPFTLAEGDVLPAGDTAIVATKQVVHDEDFDFDDLVMLLAVSTTRTGLVFSEDDDTVLGGFDLAAREPLCWAANLGLAIPVTGDPVGKVILANGSASEAGEFQLGMIRNSG